MAILKIHNQIVDDSEKAFLEMFGEGGTSYQDVQDFISSMGEKDNKIELFLHCPGGSCIEGWAMYDALRASGKTISATIEGNCSSMATIIFLAAPKERRFAAPNAHMCIHNPFVGGVDAMPSGKLTADELDRLSAKLSAQGQQVRDEQERILNIYVERTGADREELQALMNEDKFIDMERAKALGFVGEILEPNTDLMEQKVTINASVLDRMLAKLGLKSLEDFKVVAQVVTAPNGDELDVDREEGDPQVGDAATVNGEPNGSVTLDDGTVIVVANGVIASITPAEEEEAPAEEETAEAEKEEEPQEEEAPEEDEKEKRIAELEAELEELKKQAKNEVELGILAKVEKAGGAEWLDGVLAMKSTFNANNRKFVEKTEKEEPKAIGADYMEAKRAQRFHM